MTRKSWAGMFLVVMYKLKARLEEHPKYGSVNALYCFVVDTIMGHSGTLRFEPSVIAQPRSCVRSDGVSVRLMREKAHVEPHRNCIDTPNLRPLFGL